jgi:cell division ATPase FtsA
MNEVDEMVRKVEKNSFDRVRLKARESYGIVHDDLKLVSSTITAIELDGRSVSNPIGFSGHKVRLSILNIFAPASEFNIVRSVTSHMSKNIISLIPIPLVFPKILEKTDYI